MSSAAEARAELEILARLLKVDPVELAYLEKVGPTALHELREASTDLIFAVDRQMMKRLAAGSAAIPGGVAASIGEKVLGPLLCARIAGMIEPEKAAGFAKRLSTEFLADVACEMSPSRASKVIAAIPADRTAEVAKVLTERDELVTMGRFVGHLPDASLSACLAVMPDEKLLPIAFVLSDKSKLDRVLGMLDEARTVAALNAVVASGDWDEAIDLLPHIPPGRIGPFLAQADDEDLDSVIESTTTAGRWEAFNEILAKLPAEQTTRLTARAKAAGAPVC